MDAPIIADLPFEERMKKLSEIRDNEVFLVAKYQRVKSLENLREILTEYESKSEGILLKKPNSKYYDEESFLNAWVCIQQELELIHLRIMRWKKLKY